MGRPAMPSRRTCTLRAWCMLVLVAGISGRTIAGTESRQLRASLDVTAVKVRTHAPMLLVWKMQWAGDRLLEGHLRLVFYANRKPFQTYESHDIVLAAGERTWRMLVPGGAAGPGWSRKWLHAYFVAKDAEYDLGEFDLAQRGESHVCGICLAGSPIGEATLFEQEISRALRLTDVFQGNTSNYNRPGMPVSALTQWDAKDLPTVVSQWAAFDAVMLTSSALANTNKNQLFGLQQWLRAGGRVCVCLPEQLKPHQIAFVHQLLPKRVVPAFNANGIFMARDVPTDGAWLEQHHLGRVAVVAPPSLIETPPVDQQHERLARFLWHVEEHQLPNPRIPAYSTAGSAFGSSGRRDNRAAVISGILLDALMPADVRVIPASLIGFILLVYVAIVGPGDYLLLKMLRLQKYTWITFPTVTVLTALLCVFLSNRYLSTTQLGRTLIVRDIDDQGTTLRENRFRVTFVGNTALTEETLSNYLLTPLANQRQAMELQFTGVSGADAARGVITYQGTFPGQYQVRRTMMKWSPNLDRLLTIGPSDKALPDGFPEAIQAVHEGLPANVIAQRLKDILGQQTRVKFYRGGSATTKPLSADSLYQFSNPAQNRYGSQARRRSGSRSEHAFQTSTDDAWFSLVHYLSIFLPQILPDRVDGGLSFFASLDIPVAPHGGNDYQDMALLNVRDQTNTLVVILTPGQHEIMVYRYLAKGTG